MDKKKSIFLVKLQFRVFIFGLSPYTSESDVESPANAGLSGKQLKQ